VYPGCLLVTPETPDRCDNQQRLQEQTQNHGRKAEGQIHRHVGHAWVRTSRYNVGRAQATPFIMASPLGVP
jgi:hypothetical protein